jgi:outer membrane protein assembly factor BamB
VIEACFPGPIQEPPYIFNEIVTQWGIWYASGINGYIDIPVWDWQGNISEVKVDLTEVSPDIGEVVCTHYPEGSGFENPPGNPTLHRYHAIVEFMPDPDPAVFGTHKCMVTVKDGKSKWRLYDYIDVNIDWDTDPPTSCSDNGPYQGLLDLISGDGFIKFYYDCAQDPSGVFYVFYYDDESPAWEGPFSQSFSIYECDKYLMNWPPAYPACTLVRLMENGISKYWSVDAWDHPNNKAHTTSERWGQTSKPQKRWFKLAGILGEQNINYGSPVLADMDNDGDEDVVIANRMGAIYCFDGVGGDQPGGVKWIFDTFDSALYSGPAAYDCTGDGIPEIYITTNGLEEGRIWCINGAIGNEKWSYTTTYIIDATCCLTDLNGDGGLDVAVGDNGGYLYAIDGTTKEEIWSEPFLAGGGIGSTPAAADVNGDDVPDLAFGCYDGKVYMVDGATGTKIWEFFVGTGLFSVESSPALFDANDDDIPDVIVGSKERIVCIDGKGVGGGMTNTVWQTDPLVATFRGSPALGDCNFDGVLDIVMVGLEGYGADLFIINGRDGAGIFDMDFPGKKFSNVILADVTGDGHLNVIFGVNDPFIADTERYYIVNVDRVEYGVINVDMPTTDTADQAMGMPNAPTLGDVNNDGLWDMAYGSIQGRVFVHDLGTKIPDDVQLRPWTTFHGNDLRDGNPFKDY